MENQKVEKAIVHKASINLIGGESVYDFTGKANKAGQKYLFQNLNLPKKDTYIYTREVYANSAVFSVNSGSYSEGSRTHKLYGVTFTRDKNGVFTFSTPIEVEQYTQYRPVKTAVVAKAMKTTLWG